jgi:hypothetical protein
MFRDEYAVIEPAVGVWQAPSRDAVVARTPLVEAFANDEAGAVWHVYREIAQRIPRNDYTRHASKLADALR